MSPLMRRIRLVRRHFWDVLDDDAVMVYQSIAYPLMFLAGVQMWVWAIPRTIDIALEDHLQDVWLSFTILGPVMTLAGALLDLRDRYSGAAFQAAGNTMVGGGFGIYVVVVTAQNWFGGVFAPLIFIGFSAWSLLLAVRDVRKMLRVERKLVRQ